MLPCCRAAVLLPRHIGRHRAGRPRIALNLPHEFTRVRCDVSGVCLAAACQSCQSCSCAPITRCKAGLGSTATDDAPCPPHAAVLKENTPRAFSKKKYPRQSVQDRVSCGQAVFPRSLRTTPCPLMCVSWDRHHCRHHCEAKTTCDTLHQEAAVHTRTG